MEDKYVAVIEPVIGIIRVFKHDQVAMVDPYEFSATVLYSENGEVAELAGATSKGGISFTHFREAIFKELYRLGVKHLKWNRRSKNRDKRYVMIDVLSYLERRS